MPSRVAEVDENELVLEEELERKLELDGLPYVDVASNVESEIVDTNDDDDNDDNDDGVDEVGEKGRVAEDTPELGRSVDGVVMVVEA